MDEQGPYGTSVAYGPCSLKAFSPSGTTLAIGGDRQTYRTLS
ncbi:hypothetical protein OHB11_18310 [Streptomyces zaomyceticus]|uniref:Uncharacterized protein n=1 Tax=Streptomyces zaomyceticus TaxID=68286 RepID=A0ABZ1L9S2_9ACTN|nr:hypothetical protein OG237_23225 [Streptomyces zaomyceticus]